MLAMLMGRGVAHEIGRRGCVVGRASDCDVVLRVKGVSRVHCRVQVKDGRYVCSDLDSTYGTRLNGERLRAPEVVLRSGDELVLGRARLRFVEYSPTLSNTGNPRQGGALAAPQASDAKPVDTHS